jgi:hypothetical protein
MALMAVIDWTKPEDRQTAFLRLVNSVLDGMDAQAIAMALCVSDRRASLLMYGRECPDCGEMASAVQFARATIQAMQEQVDAAAPVLAQCGEKTMQMLISDN